jgi:hypothetical protein
MKPYAIPTAPRPSRRRHACRKARHGIPKGADGPEGSAPQGRSEGEVPAGEEAGRKEASLKMREAHRRAFDSQAREALEANPGQTEDELARSMGINIKNSPEIFRRNLGLARDRQAIHSRDGKYHPGPRPLGM